MKKFNTRILQLLFVVAIAANCQSQNTYNEQQRLESVQEHPNPRMRLKLIASRVTDFNKELEKVKPHLQSFSKERYDQLHPYVIERDIPQIQRAVAEGKITYRELVLFFWYRILKYESDPSTALHAIISLNEDALKVAVEKDQLLKNNPSLAKGLFGMPLLLKDNINTEELPTTAGASILKDNKASDATVARKLKEAGAIILGKANLSEWAYYFCSGCPVGYSAIGGQTINPYGPLLFESGGSSSGSGVAVAANYAVAAIGSETSGSILSPSSQNSVVGLKPTVGSISRSGIVPISRSLDTAGPMTKSVIDNLIIYNTLIGFDSIDSFSFLASPISDLSIGDGIRGKRMAYFERLKEDSLFSNMLLFLEQEGAILVPIDKSPPSLDGFLNLLNGEMKVDLPAYMNQFASESLKGLNIEKIIQYNNTNTDQYAPYGQQLFEGMLNDPTSVYELNDIRERLMIASRLYLENLMKETNTELLLSINNYHAGLAALAHAPCLSIPMGYKESGEPANVTLISNSRMEQILFEVGIHIESKLRHRKSPESYK
jgi:amidase